MQRNSPDSPLALAHAPKEPVRGLHLLLVSDDPRWITAVREAVAAEDGLVETVSARVAVARLAGMGPRYSHVLIDRDSAYGLVDILTDLTSGTARDETTLLFLGGARDARNGIGVIAAASRRAVAATLAAQYVPPQHNTPHLPTAELLELARDGLIETRYQPIVRLSDRRPMAVEALARLNHPAHGAVTPDWFVPRFEESGLAFTLTDLVSTRALVDQTGAHFDDLDLSMALNYPLNVLSHPEAAMALDRKREALGIGASRIVIELTESRPVEDFASLTRSLDQLRALGYRISIDDVSPAVKNLERLLTLPFTGLKLDKGIVRPLGTLAPGAGYAPRVIEQAHAHGMSIVAEGVETQEMWDRLRALGVQEAQGYFAARPLPAAAVSIWWKAWNAAG